MLPCSMVHESDKWTACHNTKLHVLLIFFTMPCLFVLQCSKLAVGDRILAIDGQVLEGMDYYM